MKGINAVQRPHSWSAVDHAHMERALALGRVAAGRTSPNPSVGAVVAHGARIVGTGSTEPPGGRHAERVALAAAGEEARGGTLYVTLEPCAHHGRTSPCTAAVMESGISRVVAALKDPNPQVDGKGFRQLEAAGIRVEWGLKARAAAADHAPFASWVLRHRPYVAAKWAMTADGRIATHSGDSRWVSGERSRHHVHRLRDRYDAIMVGIGTVLKDDPRLTCRRENGRDPVRIICDSRGRTPPEARCLTTGRARTIIATADAVPEPRRQRLRSAGASLWTLPGETQPGGTLPRVSMSSLMEHLGAQEISSVLVEGGGELLASLAEEGFIDRYEIFVAPKWIGGSGAPGPMGGPGRDPMTTAAPLVWAKMRRSGKDLWLTAYPQGGEPLDVYWNRR